MSIMCLCKQVSRAVTCDIYHISRLLLVLVILHHHCNYGLTLEIISGTRRNSTEATKSPTIIKGVGKSFNLLSKTNETSHVNVSDKFSPNPDEKVASHSSETTLRPDDKLSSNLNVTSSNSKNKRSSRSRSASRTRPSGKKVEKRPTKKLRHHTNNQKQIRNRKHNSGRNHKKTNPPKPSRHKRPKHNPQHTSHQHKHHKLPPRHSKLKHKHNQLIKTKQDYHRPTKPNQHHRAQKPHQQSQRHHNHNQHHHDHQHHSQHNHQQQHHNHQQQHQDHQHHSQQQHHKHQQQHHHKHQQQHQHNHQQQHQHNHQQQHQDHQHQQHNHRQQQHHKHQQQHNHQQQQHNHQQEHHNQQEHHQQPQSRQQHKPRLDHHQPKGPTHHSANGAGNSKSHNHGTTTHINHEEIQSPASHHGPNHHQPQTKRPAQLQGQHFHAHHSHLEPHKKPPNQSRDSKNHNGHHLHERGQLSSRPEGHEHHEHNPDHEHSNTNQAHNVMRPHTHGHGSVQTHHPSNDKEPGHHGQNTHHLPGGNKSPENQKHHSEHGAQDVDNRLKQKVTKQKQEHHQNSPPNGRVPIHEGHSSLKHKDINGHGKPAHSGSGGGMAQHHEKQGEGMSKNQHEQHINEGLGPQPNDHVPQHKQQVLQQHQHDASETHHGGHNEVIHHHQDGKKQAHISDPPQLQTSGKLASPADQNHQVHHAEENKHEAHEPQRNHKLSQSTSHNDPQHQEKSHKQAGDTGAQSQNQGPNKLGFHTTRHPGANKLSTHHPKQQQEQQQHAAAPGVASSPSSAAHLQPPKKTPQEHMQMGDVGTSQHNQESQHSITAPPPNQHPNEKQQHEMSEPSDKKSQNHNAHSLTLDQTSPHQSASSSDKSGSEAGPSERPSPAGGDARSQRAKRARGGIPADPTDAPPQLQSAWASSDHLTARPPQGDRHQGYGIQTGPDTIILPEGLADVINPSKSKEFEIVSDHIHGIEKQSIKKREEELKNQGITQLSEGEPFNLQKLDKLGKSLSGTNPPRLAPFDMLHLRDEAFAGHPDHPDLEYSPVTLVKDLNNSTFGEYKIVQKQKFPDPPPKHLGDTRPERTAMPKFERDKKEYGTNCHLVTYSTNPRSRSRAGQLPAIKYLHLVKIPVQVSPSYCDRRGHCILSTTEADDYVCEDDRGAAVMCNGKITYLVKTAKSTHGGCRSTFRVSHVPHMLS